MHEDYYVELLDEFDVLMDTVYAYDFTTVKNIADEHAEQSKNYSARVMHILYNTKNKIIL